MQWTKKNIILIILLVASGTAYTLMLKFSSTESAKNSIGIEETFNHPFLQVSGYFFGELLCLLLYYGYKFFQFQYAKKVQYGKDSVKVIEQQKVIVEEVIVHEKTLIADDSNVEGEDAKSQETIGQVSH